jgi:hypothetical protein
MRRSDPCDTAGLGSLRLPIRRRSSAHARSVTCREETAASHAQTGMNTASFVALIASARIAVVAFFIRRASEGTAVQRVVDRSDQARDAGARHAGPPRAVRATVRREAARRGEIAQRQTDPAGELVDADLSVAVAVADAGLSHDGARRQKNESEGNRDPCRLHEPNPLFGSRVRPRDQQRQTPLCGSLGDEGHRANSCATRSAWRVASMAMNRRWACCSRSVRAASSPSARHSAAHSRWMNGT